MLAAGTTAGDHRRKEKTMLEQAIALARSGDKAAARQMLARVIAQDPKNELAWMWLAWCAKTKADRRYALECVLEMNPTNDRARAELRKLGQSKHARRGRRILLLVGGIIIATVFAVLSVLSYDGGTDSYGGSGREIAPTQPAAQPHQRSVQPRAHTIRYKVKGTTHRASITYENKSGNAEQISDVSVPWETWFDARAGQFVYVSAQNAEEWGTVECQILQDGKVIEQAKSDGAYTIATCSGRVGD